MWNAITAFRCESDEQKRSFRFNSRLFEKAKMIAVQLYGGFGENNSMWGRHHSEETKAKMRAYATGRKHSEETRRKISLGNKGKHCNKGRVVSEETRRKMSLAMKGRKLTDEHKEQLKQLAMKNRKPVCRFALDGTFIDEFSSAYEIADILGITPMAIQMCCRGVNRTCHGFVFKYKEG